MKEDKTLKETLKELAGDGPHPTRDAFLESALLRAYRNGELITKDEHEEIVNSLWRNIDMKAEFIDRMIDSSYDDYAKVKTLEEQIDRLMETLNIFANSKSWLYNGICDPDSPNFKGLDIAANEIAKLNSMKKGL